MTLSLLPRMVGRMRKVSPSGGDPITAAVADLYRACHFHPPAVVVARDAVHFGQIIGRLAYPFSFVEAMACLLLVCILLGVVLPKEDGAFPAAYGTVMAVLFMPWVIAARRAHHSHAAAFREVALRTSVSLLIGAAAYGTARLTVAEHHFALQAAGIAVAAGACAQLAFVAVAPCLARWRLGRALTTADRPVPWSAILLGASRVDDILTARLASALQDIERESGPRSAFRARSDHGEAQWIMQTAIRDAVQDLGFLGSDLGLVLGRSVGRLTDPAAQISGMASVGMDPAGLPRILVPAMELARRAEAVAAFRGIAVMLPAGAPARFTPPPANLHAYRRSGRLPWGEALRWLGDMPGLALAVDLSPSDRMADWLLARHLVWIPEAERRTPAMRALGVERVVAARRIRPVHEDECGTLFQIGRKQEPSAFVVVRDRVLDPNGRALEHWIAVPPYIATAREAVAWSFGMQETEYRPMREA